MDQHWVTYVAIVLAELTVAARTNTIIQNRKHAPENPLGIVLCGGGTRDPCKPNQSVSPGCSGHMVRAVIPHPLKIIREPHPDRVHTWD